MRNTFGTRRGLNDTTAYEYGKHIKTVWKSPPFLAFFEQRSLSIKICIQAVSGFAWLFIGV